MQRLRKDWLYILIIAATLFYMVWSGYIFYFASCEIAKQNWLLVEAPGRCL